MKYPNVYLANVFIFVATLATISPGDSKMLMHLIRACLGLAVLLRGIPESRPSSAVPSLVKLGGVVLLAQILIVVGFLSLNWPSPF